MNNTYINSVIHLLNAYSVIQRMALIGVDEEIKKECKKEVYYIGFLLRIYLILFKGAVTLIEISQLLGMRVFNLNTILFYIHTTKWNENTKQFDVMAVNKFTEVEMMVLNHMFQSNRLFNFKKCTRNDEIFKEVRTYICSVTNFSEHNFLLPSEEKQNLVTRLIEFDKMKEKEIKALPTSVVVQTI